MTKKEDYRIKLRTLKNWTSYLLRNSGLPGPRGNLELAHAVAQEASKVQIEQFLALPAEQTGENTAGVFVLFCGVLGLGKLAARGEHDQLSRLRIYASDTRWRIREAVATGLQLVGDQSMSLLVQEMREWSRGNWYEKRAAAAALAEPRLLKQPRIILEVFGIFDTITADIASAGNTGTEGFNVIRQAMGYCWSVAVAALPLEGKAAMEKWLPVENPDVRWIMKQNLRKSRLIRMDAAWVAHCLDSYDEIR